MIGELNLEHELKFGAALGRDSAMLCKLEGAIQ